MVEYVDLSGILVKYSRTVDKDIDKVIDKDKTIPALLKKSKKKFLTFA